MPDFIDIPAEEAEAVLEGSADQITQVDATADTLEIVFADEDRLLVSATVGGTLTYARTERTDAP